MSVESDIHDKIGEIEAFKREVLFREEMKKLIEAAIPYVRQGQGLVVSITPVLQEHTD